MGNSVVIIFREKYLEILVNLDHFFSLQIIYKIINAKRFSKTVIFLLLRRSGREAETAGEHERKVTISLDCRLGNWK